MQGEWPTLSNEWLTLLRKLVECDLEKNMQFFGPGFLFLGINTKKIVTSMYKTYKNMFKSEKLWISPVSSQDHLCMYQSWTYDAIIKMILKINILTKNCIQNIILSYRNMYAIH